MKESRWVGCSKPNINLKKTAGLSTEQAIARHKYSDLTVSLSSHIYAGCGCGSGKTVEFLKIDELRVLDMEVKKSWNSETVREEFDKVENRMGAPPACVISDNAGTISKAVSDKAYNHVRDAGHSFGLCLQQVYEKDENFKSLIVHRAAKMLKSFDRLNTEEQKVFHFIPTNRLLIQELSMVFQSVNSILQRLKNKGISKVSAKKCLSELNSLFSSSNQRIASLGRLMAEYIEREYDNLSDESEKRHVSSDIIESMFGAYKGRKSPNKMNGVIKE